MHLSCRCICIFVLATPCGLLGMAWLGLASLASYESMKLQMSLYKPTFALPWAANLT